MISYDSVRWRFARQERDKELTRKLAAALAVDHPLDSPERMKLRAEVLDELTKMAQAWIVAETALFESRDIIALVCNMLSVERQNKLAIKRESEIQYKKNIKETYM